jgi:hypothetical protein
MGDPLRRALAQALVVTPPRAVTQNTTPHGQAVVLALVQATTIAINLRTLVATFKSTVSGNYQNTYEPVSPEGMLALGAPLGGAGGGVGSFITLAPEGTDVGIIFGSNLAAISGGNAPNLGTAGAVDGNGNYTAVPGTCLRIRDLLQTVSPPPRFRLERTQDEWLGVVVPAMAPGTALLRLYISSEAALTT